MASHKLAVLIIPGAWHFPHHYAKLKSALEEAGYEVHIPQLPSVTEPAAGLYADSDIVREQATTLVNNGQNVIVIMHSYGGQVGTNALHSLGAKERSATGKPGGITHLVYMTAAAYLERMSMEDKVVQLGFGDLLPIAFPDDGSGILHCSNPRVQMFGEDYEGPEIEAYLASFGLWNSKCRTQPMQNACAWRNIPVTYIQTTQDNTIPLAFQVNIVESLEKEGIKVKTHQLDASHCPHFTHASEIVEIVRGLDNIG